MNQLEKQIILMAHENHSHERRAPAHWRVVIRAYISQSPLELSSETKMINGIDESNWMKFADLNPVKNLVMDARNRLMEFLNSHHIESIEPSRTNRIQPEIFLKLGYVFVTSNKLFEKSKADVLLQDWRKLGLDTFILCELPPGGDLFANEALSLSKYADLIKTSHIISKGHIGRVPGSVESVLIGAKKDDIEDATKLIDSTFQALEKEGFAVRVKGYNLCFTWDGIALTRTGVAMAKEIQENPGAGSV